MAGLRRKLGIVWFFGFGNCAFRGSQILGLEDRISPTACTAPGNQRPEK